MNGYHISTDDINLAIEHEKTDLALYLINQVDDVAIINTNFNTPLIEANKKGNFEIVKLLLDKGADPNLPNEQGELPLVEAGKKGNFDIVKLLLDQGANPELKDNKSMNIIKIAKIKGYTKELTELLKQDKDPKMQKGAAEDTQPLATPSQRPLPSAPPREDDWLFYGHPEEEITVAVPVGEAPHAGETVAIATPVDPQNSHTATLAMQRQEQQSKGHARY